MKFCPKCGEKIKGEEDISFVEPILVLISVTFLYIISLFLNIWYNTHERIKNV